MEQKDNVNISQFQESEIPIDREIKTALEKRILILREKANKLPLKSGIYIMKNKKNEVIYVGKAKKLKNRVVSYFRGLENHTPKVYKMVTQVSDFDTIITNNEFEALVLECSLIKQHTPKYNILLKDAKGYNYIKISRETYPKITAEKNNNEQGDYIGPFMSYYAMKQAVDYANKLFHLPVCNKSFPRDIRKSRPCLNYHIFSCMGVCTGKISFEEFMQNHRRAVKFLKGNTTELLNELEKEMNLLAEKLEFEKASKVRDKIKGLKAVKEKQMVMFKTAKEQDAVAIVRGDKDICFSVLKIRDGRLVDKNDFLSELDISNNELFHEFLTNYYYQNEDIPPRIYLNEKCKDSELIIKMIKEISDKNVVFYIPDKGENYKIVQTAEQNAREYLALNTKKSNKYFDSLEDLRKLLNLKNLPRYIESYDISNLGDDSIVAGMIVFEDSMPKKKAYKRFEIKGLDGRDDYASMAQVITRRFLRYKEAICAEKDGKSLVKTGFEVKPDLILLDGGVGHVSVITAVLKDMNLDIPVFGMVKNSKHKTKAIAPPSSFNHKNSEEADDLKVKCREIEIAANKNVFALVTKIQDEVHRFSVDYLRKKLKAKTLVTELTEIETIGKVKADSLIREFKSIENVKKADMDQLCQVKGINKINAEKIIEYFSV